MKNFKKAFTLTELLIALAVIGILVAILVPVIFNLMPDQNVLMAKRAYYAVQTVVSDLINDEGCYPDKTQSMGADRRLGFDDGFGYPNCLKWGGNSATSATIFNEGSPTTKFVTLFADKVDVQDGTFSTSGFQTKDGMKWTFRSGASAKSLHSSLNAMNDLFALITIDVNGSGERPNCGQAVTTSACSKGNTYDQFAIAVNTDGKLTILDGWARSAVKINKDVSGTQGSTESTIAPR